MTETSVVRPLDRTATGARGPRPEVRSAAVVWTTCRAAVLLLPLGGMSVPGFPLNPIIVIFAIPSILTVLHVSRGGRPVAGARASALLLVFGAVLTASAFGTAAPGRTIELLFVTFVGIGFAVSLTFCVESIDRVRTLCGDLMLALIVCAVWAIATLPELTTRFGGGAIDGRATGPFAQPNELGIACAAGLPIAFILLCHAGRRRERVLAGIGMPVLAAALILSFSRGGWIAAMAGCALVIVVLPSVRRTVAVLVLVAIGTAGYLTLFSWDHGTTTDLVVNRLESIGDVSENPGDHRTEIWGESLRQFSEHPLLGTGPEGFQEHAASSGGPVANIRPPHPHNIYLSYLNEVGILGMIPLSLFMGYVVGNVVRIAKMARRTPPDSVSAGTAAVVFIPPAALFVILVHGVVDDPLGNGMVAYTWWTLLGLAGLGTTFVQRREQDREVAR